MDAAIRLLQFTDPHLMGHASATVRGVQTLASMQAVLAHASDQPEVIDALVCTGDIVNDQPDGYALFARELAALGKPVYCIPGNHDDPARLRSALSRAPFQVGGHVDLGAWRLVLVDSCLPGQVRGRVSPAELAALDTALRGAPHHAMVFVHHHPVSMGSRWLDAVGIENAGEFLEVIDAHAQLRAVSWGHVHQDFDAWRRGVRLLATPSTCIQFQPRAHEFAVDALPPAYRRLLLQPDGTLDTEVVWVDEVMAGRASASSATG